MISAKLPQILSQLYFTDSDGTNPEAVVTVGVGDGFGTG